MAGSFLSSSVSQGGFGAVTAGNWTTHADTDPKVNARTVGVYLRADPEDVTILDGRDNRLRAKLIADRLKHWKAMTTT